MTGNVQITDPLSGRNYLPWLHEKTRNIIVALCNTSLDDLSEKDVISIRYAFSNAIKIYSFITGKNQIYDEAIIDFILKNGTEALEVVEIWAEIKEKPYPYLSEFYKIEECIASHESGRTEIHTIVAKMPSDNDWICEIKDDIEMVTQNYRTWKWFCEKHKDDKKEYLLYPKSEVQKKFEVLLAKRKEKV